MKLVFGFALGCVVSFGIIIYNTVKCNDENNVEKYNGHDRSDLF
jgi:hypothetical protein